MKAEDDQEIDSHLIQSEALRIEGSTYFMQGMDGEEVNLRRTSINWMVDLCIGKPKSRARREREAGITE